MELVWPLGLHFSFFVEHKYLLKRKKVMRTTGNDYRIVRIFLWVRNKTTFSKKLSLWFNWGLGDRLCIFSRRRVLQRRIFLNRNIIRSKFLMFKIWKVNISEMKTCKRNGNNIIWVNCVRKYFIWINTIQNEEKSNKRKGNEDTENQKCRRQMTEHYNGRRPFIVDSRWCELYELRIIW